MTTLSDFYTEVLRELKVTAPNGSAQAEDRKRVEDTYPRIWHLLFERGLVNWSVTDDVPDWATIPMVKIVAYSLSSNFGAKGERLALLRAEGEIDGRPPSWGERQLRKTIAADYVPSTYAAEYF